MQLSVCNESFFFFGKGTAESKDDSSLSSSFPALAREKGESGISIADLACNLKCRDGVGEAHLPSPFESLFFHAEMALKWILVPPLPAPFALFPPCGDIHLEILIEKKSFFSPPLDKNHYARNEQKNKTTRAGGNVFIQVPHVCAQRCEKNRPTESEAFFRVPS